jgi:NAD(P)-dependent dehydrogenase (short-subunit alcohol dehydrogenase family)
MIGHRFGEERLPMTPSNTSMSGKVVIVTGSTDGIGKATARALAAMGATVVIVGRNPDKTTATVEELRAATGNEQIEGMLADFASLAQVRQLADAFKQKRDRLDVLINNAGAVFAKRGETEDGFEQTFGVDHLAPFLLTNLLLDLLKQSAPSRIVNVSSEGHKVSGMRFDDLQAERRYTAMGAYGQAKLANVLFTYELARRLRGTGVTVNALHPGSVASNFGAGQAGLLAPVIRFFITRFGITPEEGAQTSVYVASSPDVAGVTGKYWIKSKPVRSSAASYDNEAAERLWQISAEMTGLAA